jgi:hypothetical protein
LRRTRDLHFKAENIAYVLQISEEKAAELLDALLALGYVGPPSSVEDKGLFESTVKGNALTLAHASKPIQRKTADRILDEFLARVENVNEDAYFLYKVDDVRVFGSYLTDADRLGNLDVALTLVPFTEDQVAFRKLCEGRIREAYKAGRQFSNIVERLFWPRREVLLFLKNRSKALSLHESDDSVVKDDNARVAYRRPGSIVSGHAL